MMSARREDTVMEMNTNNVTMSKSACLGGLVTEESSSWHKEPNKRSQNAIQYVLA